MASVSDTVYKMLTQYPSLFKTKSDCLVHLFLVNGNGYEWIDGELVSCYETKSEPDFKDEDTEVEKYRSKDAHDWADSHYNWVRLDVRRNNAQIQFVMDNFDLLMDETCSINGNVYYSGWEYSKMMQCPDDITDDWREAIQDMFFAITPYANQILSRGDERQRQTEELVKDVQRLKEERFSDELKRDKARSKMITEILKEIEQV